ncbi:hypothetical protein EJB05_31580, partial [Eragrostis curvula]
MQGVARHHLDAAFIRAHLRCSASKRDHDEHQSFIISPNVEEWEGWNSGPSRFIRLYLWKQGASMAEHMHAKEYFLASTQAGDRTFAHCDGLVFAPTDPILFVFNPATREVVELPYADQINVRRHYRNACYSAGLGRDPGGGGGGRYKVVQAFFRTEQPYVTKTVPVMGILVFTIGEGCTGVWREIEDDLPYNVMRYQTAVHVNGFLFWRIGGRYVEPPPQGILCLSLRDEKLSLTGLPGSLGPAAFEYESDDGFAFDALNGRELCLAARTTTETLTIWTMAIEDDYCGGSNSQPSSWEKRYCIHASDLFHPVAVLPGGSGIILREHRYGMALYRYELATSELSTFRNMIRINYQGRPRKWKDLRFCNVMPYTESLVRLAA